MVAGDLELFSSAREALLEEGVLLVYLDALLLDSNGLLLRFKGVLLQSGKVLLKPGEVLKKPGEVFLELVNIQLIGTCGTLSSLLFHVEVQWEGGRRRTMIIPLFVTVLIVSTDIPEKSHLL